MNERELDVLSALWKSKEPMSAMDIVSDKRELTQSTVTAVLRKLLNEEMVEVAGVTHSGKVLSRIYKPTSKSKDVTIKFFAEKLDTIKYIATIDEIKKAMSK